MTVDAFRKLALLLPEVVEQVHMGHPDFRLRGKVFASLGYPDEDHAMVKLTPEQQAALVHAWPLQFMPAAGAWGRRGSTLIVLPAADPDLVRDALDMAWRNVAPKLLIRLHSEDPDV